MVSKIDGPFGISITPAFLVLVLSPIIDRGNTRLHLFVEVGDGVLHRPRRIERLGRHHIVHAIVKILDAELRLLQREVAILRVLGDLGVGQPSQGAILLLHDRPKALEPGAAERRVVHEQEIAAPKALARDRPVGLRVNGEENARRTVRFRYAFDQHQNVSIRVGVNGAWAQCRFRQGHHVKVGAVIARRHAHGSSLDDVGDRRQIPGERCCKPQRLWRGWLHRRGWGCRRRSRRSEQLLQGIGLWGRLRGGGNLFGGLLRRRRRARDLGMLDIEPLVALRRSAAVAARAVRIAKRQAHLEGEIGAQEINEIRRSRGAWLSADCLRRDPDS